MNRTLTKFVGILVLGLLLFSFGFAKSNVPSDTLVIAANTGIFITLDPGMVYEVLPGKIVDAMYAKIVELEAQGETLVPVPRLAEKWEISEDAMTYTFTMRKGLKFANGDPLNANDAVWSLKRSMKMNSSSKWLIESVGINEENADQTITLIDDYTFTMQFDKPYASNIILGILTNQFASVVNRKQLEPHMAGDDLGQKWLDDNSAGAGAYVLQRWERNNQIVLVANPNYVLGQPKIRRIIVRDVPEAANQRLMVEKGDADVAWNVTGTMLKEMSGNKELRIVRVPGHGNEYLAMNASWGPLKDAKVRLAVKYALNYDEIIDILMDGNALKVQGFVSKGYFGYVADNPFYPDVEKAKKLLADAGYPNGFEVELLTSNANPRPAEAEKIQADLAKVGIKANIVIVQASQ
ncbi:MAG TPA: ABC transporter substrate-binding protein, partial [Thermotogota bacterium]|nr:ABC transporter substrate-binding protein [Thermotogota bacterium]